MTGHLSFSLSAPIGAAILMGALQPICLWLLTLVPALRGRNAAQFLLSSIATFTAFILYNILFESADAGFDAAMGILILICASLLYLEAWALLSRGYTIGLLLTLLKADSRGLTRDELSSRYRGGDGIDWIMAHRLSGLISAGLVERKVDQLRLTDLPGLPVVQLYRIAIAFLGLGRTG
jgi:hypothetical protein